MINIVFALASLLFFGIGVFLYKMGTTGFSSGLGGSIYIASHLIVLGSVALIEQTRLNTVGLKYLIIGGMFSGLAQVFFFAALRSGKITAVVPIRNLSLLVTVLLGIFVLSESLTMTRALGLFAGVVAIILLSI